MDSNYKLRNNFSYPAFLSALSISFFILDSLIPKPLPFFRIGLSNSITTYLIFNKKYKFAMIVAFTKVLLGNLIVGTFLSPTFLLSLSGTSFALLFMIIFKLSKINFSILGISIIGALAHNITQLCIARLILINDNSVFYFVPLMILLSIFTGLITGYVAIYLEKFFRKWEMEQ